MPGEPMSEVICVSAPGSLMLMGEHAVLHGKPCLVTSVSQRMRLTLRARADQEVRIRSALGEYTGTLHEIEVTNPFRFVLAAVQARTPELAYGFELEIASDFSDQVGFGSSAAVTVCVHEALNAWHKTTGRRQQLLAQCVATVRTVQGMGSGADVAASIWGGTVFYRADALEAKPLKQTCPLTVIYSGHKTPTPDVVARVEAARQADPRAFEEIFDAIGKLVEEAVPFVEGADWVRLGRLFDANQERMSELGVSDALLDELVGMLRRRAGIHGAKISGAGLGDCVIGLGRADLSETGYAVIDAQTSRKGVTLD